MKPDFLQSETVASAAPLAAASDVGAGDSDAGTDGQVVGVALGWSLQRPRRRFCAELREKVKPLEVVGADLEEDMEVGDERVGHEKCNKLHLQTKTVD